MATDVRNLPAYFSNNADFQAWVTGITAQLTACGMTQTGDTGQINPATVVLPGAGAAAGYQVWRFNDSQQSARPLYMKLEYGTYNPVNQPSLWITAGSGSDGAGNITGATTTRAQVAQVVGKSAGITLPSYCSGDGSRIALVTNYDIGNFQCAGMLLIDRTRDANNNTTSEGVVVYTSLAVSPGPYCQMLYAGGVTARVSAATGSFFMSARAASGQMWAAGLTALGSNVGLMPLIVMVGQPRYLIAGAFCNQNDLAGGSIVTVQNLGGNHTYIILPTQYQSALTYNSDGWAILWE